ncbi:hypothetical protein AciM339_1455 [Aciduliprofundum sp. MAR08-339]|nr:hypothetical protein AciM339_1455 [Aciduliprofundum sp. MAR08-339]
MNEDYIYKTPIPLSKGDVSQEESQGGMKNVSTSEKKSR